MSIRPATPADIGTIMQMYAHSRSLMRAAGNQCQWVGYPTEDDVRADIDSHVSYFIEQDSKPAGTFALVPGIEPTYGVIAHGRWIDTRTPYATLHRLAKTTEGCHIADTAFSYSKAHCDHMRADTHADNTAMRAILAKEGFVHCGTVFMDDGSPRLAYEWWRYDQVPQDLKDYVETAILPRYDHFDTAHRRDHARRVIARAMMLQSTALVYTAAAMHDLGLAEGREQHHLVSGRIIRATDELYRWFSDAEIELIAQAAEDHRASATTPPRSELGCIIAEADRDVEPETIVRRTVEYGLSHYPSLDREGHWARTLQHLDEKYSAHGYIKLWLPDSPNAEPLEELRSLITDTARLRSLFDNIMETSWTSR